MVRYRQISMKYIGFPIKMELKKLKKSKKLKKLKKLGPQNHPKSRSYPVPLASGAIVYLYMYIYIYMHTDKAIQ